MIRRVFRFATDEDTGFEGWLMVGGPSNFQPLGAMGTVHDLLEHPKDDTGTADEEALAFGAACYVRGEGGYWYQKGSHINDVGEHFASDISRALAGDAGFELSDPPRTRPVDEQVEDWITSAITKTRHLLVHEHEVHWGAGDEQNLQRFRGWVRIGYRRARRRYRHQDAGSMTSIFIRLEDLVERASKGAEEGDQLELGLCIRTGKLLCRKTDRYELEPYDQDY